MTREIFTTGWSFRSKVTAFQELGGSSANEWTDVQLPHDAIIGTARDADAPHGETNGYFRGGAFEYRRTFHAPAAHRGRQLFLELDGVYRDAAIFVNGNLAGQRANGYSRFLVRIDPYLHFDADNEIRVECRTHLDSRWYAGAGIYRDVHLIVKNPLHIANDGVRISTPDVEADRAVVEVEVEIENASAVTATARLDIAIQDAGGSPVAVASSPITLLPGASGTVRQRLYVRDPELWSVDAPQLYSVELDLRDADESVDEQSVRFGIRSLQLDPDRGLRINGETVKLRGACIHSDNGPLGAVSTRPAELRRVRLLKEAGFNAIRSAHNPLSTALLEACDELGMLVMDETFDMWTSGKSDFDYSFDFPEWWERDVEAMVAKDLNHPSVIFYSIGNEIPETGTPIGSTWGRRLAEKVRSLDPTRYVTNGVNGFVSMLDTIVPQMQARRDAAAADQGGGVNTMMAGFGQMMDYIQASEDATTRTEESYAVLDVAGMNYSHARYELDRELFPNRIIVGTETWPNSIAGNWELVKANGHVLGDFTWTGWDYLGEVGIGTIRYADAAASGSGFSGGFPELTAWCGDLDITGHRRPVSYFREIVFGLRSDPYIAVRRPETHGREIAIQTPWAWSDSIASWSWDGFEGKPVTVEIYSDSEEVELLLDGVSLGRTAVEGFRAEIETVYQPGTLTAVAFVGSSETGRFELVTAGSALVIEGSADRTELAADGNDLAYVEFTLADDGGIVRPDRDIPLTISVDGPAVLQALGSGNPSTTEMFDLPTHTTFDGRALAIVRPTGPGEVTVTASAAGYRTATVSLASR